MFIICRGLSTLYVNQLANSMIELEVLNSETRFKCLDECVNCCHEIVHLLPIDLLNLSKICNIWDVVRFIPNVTDRGRQVVGKGMTGTMTLEKTKDGACVFLDEGKCAVYDYRPLVCQLYPIDPLFIETEKESRRTMRLDFDGCPGLGQGKKLNNKSIEDLAEEWRTERMNYDKCVDSWNTNPRGNLIDFVKELLP